MRRSRQSRRSAANIRSATVGYFMQSSNGTQLGANALQLVTGRWFARERVGRKLEQFVVAEELGMTQGAYSRLERGIAAWTLERFIATCVVFDVRPQLVLEELLGELHDSRPKAEPDPVKATADLFPAEPPKSSSGKRPTKRRK